MVRLGSPKSPPLPKAIMWDAESVAKCKAAHAFYDVDGSGAINYKELVPALERYGINLPKGTEVCQHD